MIATVRRHRCSPSTHWHLLLLLLLGCVTLVAQRPIVVKLSCERSVGLYVRASVVLSSALWKAADRIRMPFGIVGQMGPGMRQVVGFGDRSTGRGTFGGEFGAHRCPKGPIGCTCATAQRRGPLPKLLWADFLLLLLHICLLYVNVVSKEIIINSKGYYYIKPFGSRLQLVHWTEA